MTTPVNEFNVIVETSPRTIQWNTTDGPTQMMSEIGDGVFAAWLPLSLDPAGLPVEPEYIQRWREAHRAKSDPAPVVGALSTAPAYTTLAYAGLPRPVVPTPVQKPTEGDTSDVGF
jgi:hypothetical protein